MHILAIDQSTTTGSAALVYERRVIASETWHDTHSPNRQLSSALRCLFTRAGLGIEAPDMIVVGLGPGSFAGIRTALAMARALALPDRTPVAGLPSPAAIAYELAREGLGAHISVAGNARRDRLWLAQYAYSRGKLECCHGPALVREERLFEKIPAGHLLVSADQAGGLATRLRDACPPGITPLSKPRVPDAGHLGILAYTRRNQILRGPVASPIYLHPPVPTPRRH